MSEPALTHEEQLELLAAMRKLNQAQAEYLASLQFARDFAREVNPE